MDSNETATIMTNYNGELSVQSNNTNVAITTISDKTFTVTGVAEGTTTHIVTGLAAQMYSTIYCSETKLFYCV